MSAKYVDGDARIEAIREYLRDSKIAVQPSDPPERHQEALDGIWKECLRQGDDQDSPALYYCGQAVRSGRGDAETREQYESRLNGIPSKAFAQEDDPGSVYEGVDKPQHFFTAASISWNESSVSGRVIGEVTAKGLGRAYEVKDAIGYR